MARFTYWEENEESEAILVSVTRAKQLLKEKGGRAWTQHCDKDGTCFEVTAVQLAGNNSRFRYNRHL